MSLIFRGQRIELLTYYMQCATLYNYLFYEEIAVFNCQLFHNKKTIISNYKQVSKLHVLTNSL
jgi:hypothetical protein